MKVLREIPTIGRNELAEKLARSAFRSSRMPDEVCVVEDAELGAHPAWRVTAPLTGGMTLLYSRPETGDKIRIGRDTYINRGTMLDAHQKIWIEDRVLVGAGCYITDSDHGMKAAQSVKAQPMVKGKVVTKRAGANEMMEEVPAQKTGLR